MQSWMESCLRIHQPSVSVSVGPSPTRTAPQGFGGEFVHLIAAMVFEIHRQGALS
jgi:hypothetical protein